MSQWNERVHFSYTHRRVECARRPSPPPARLDRAQRQPAGSRRRELACSKQEQEQEQQARQPIPPALQQQTTGFSLAATHRPSAHTSPAVAHLAHALHAAPPKHWHRWPAESSSVPPIPSTVRTNSPQSTARTSPALLYLFHSSH